ncbi:MAG: glutamine amidotransferase [Pseudomonadota bacterium]
MLERTYKPMLVILHQETSTPGRVGHKLMARGYSLDIRRPALGCTLPETLDEHSGAVMFGGPQSAYDDDDFIACETDWIGVPLKEERPFLGLCLGAQIMARHLGAEVKPDPDGHVEVGYYPITPTPEGEALLDWPSMVYQWHRDGFDLPDGATRLATADSRFPEQAYQVGPAAFGLQFHPELTMAMTYRWTVKGAERMACPGAQPRRAHIEGRLRYDAAVDVFLERLLDVWLASDSLAIDTKTATAMNVAAE